MPGDGQEPGSEAGSVLQNVGSSLAVVDLAGRHRPDGAGVSPVKLGKRLRVPGPDGLDEFRVASGRCRRDHVRNGSRRRLAPIVAGAASIVLALLATLVLLGAPLLGGTATEPRRPSRPLCALSRAPL